MSSVWGHSSAGRAPACHVALHNPEKYCNDWIFNFYKKYKLYLDNFLIHDFFDYEEIEDFDVVFIMGYTRIIQSK